MTFSNMGKSSLPLLLAALTLLPSTLGQQCELGSITGNWPAGYTVNSPDCTMTYYPGDTININLDYYGLAPSYSIEKRIVATNWTLTPKQVCGFSITVLAPDGVSKVADIPDNDPQITPTDPAVSHTYTIPYTIPDDWQGVYHIDFQSDYIDQTGTDCSSPVGSSIACSMLPLTVSRK